MAYYAYKRVRDLIPDKFQEAYINYNDNVYYKGHSQYTYDGDPSYDGDMWFMVATYIKWLQTPLTYDTYDDFFKAEGVF